MIIEWTKVCEDVWEGSSGGFWISLIRYPRDELFEALVEWDEEEHSDTTRAAVQVRVRLFSCPTVDMAKDYVIERTLTLLSKLIRETVEEE